MRLGVRTPRAPLPVAARHRAASPRGRAHHSCSFARSRCGRARCPHRATAPSARCAAWQVAHAESFACRGSVRGTVRGRAAHPARCLAAGPPGSRRHLPTRHEARAFTHGHGARNIRTPLPTRKIRPRITAPLPESACDKKAGRSILDSPGHLSKIGWKSVNRKEDGLRLFSQAVLLWQEERPATDGTARDSRQRLPQERYLQ